MPEINVDNVPFEEAIRQLTTKLRIKTRHYDDLTGDIHAKAFTVAGATKTGLLKDLHDSVNDAIRNGESIGKFRRRFDEIVQKHGWSYKGARGWRTRVIYDTNLRTAHMAGRWEQIQRTKERRPLLQYLTAGDNRVRDEHANWHTLVLPVDDPWWDTHYPPNGWGCRCTVRTLSERQAKREGLEPETAPEVERTPRMNTSSGEDLGLVPKGIDSGWDYNVGKAWLGPDIDLGRKLAALPPDLRGSALSSGAMAAWVASQRAPFANWTNAALRTSTTAGGARPVAHIDDEVITWLERRGVGVETSAIAVTDRRIRHMRSDRKGEAAMGDDELARLPDIMLEARAVLLQESTGNLVYVVGAQGRTRSIVIVEPGQRRRGEPVNDIVSGRKGVADHTLRDEKSYTRIKGEI